MNAISYTIVFLNYAAWMLPVSIVAVFMLKYSEESGHTGGLFWIVLSFILMGLSIGVREFLFLSISYQPIAFFIGNTAILIACWTLLRAVEQTEKEVHRGIRMPQRVRLYSVVIFIVALYPTAKNESAYTVVCSFYVFVFIYKKFRVNTEQQYVHYL